MANWLQGKFHSALPARLAHPAPLVSRERPGSLNTHTASPANRPECAQPANGGPHSCLQWRRCRRCRSSQRCEVSRTRGCTAGRVEVAPAGGRGLHVRPACSHAAVLAVITHRAGGQGPQPVMLPTSAIAYGNAQHLSCRLPRCLEPPQVAGQHPPKLMERATAGAVGGEAQGDGSRQLDMLACRTAIHRAGQQHWNPLGTDTQQPGGGQAGAAALT